MPERVQLSRRPGWRKPENTVVVARPTRWGNDWRVTPWTNEHGEHRWSVWNVRTGATRSQHNTKAEAIRFAVEYFRVDAADLDVSELRGRNLACWCSLSDPCHADVLLELANPGAPDG